MAAVTKAKSSRREYIIYKAESKFYNLYSYSLERLDKISSSVIMVAPQVMFVTGASAESWFHPPRV